MDDTTKSSQKLEPPIRVVIADDQPRARQGLKALLATCSEMEVIGEAENGCQAVQLVGDTNPDVVLIDVRMPVMDGLTATRLIKKLDPQLRVVMISIHSNHRADAHTAGADVFLIKGCPPDDIVESILHHNVSQSDDEEKQG